MKNYSNWDFLSHMFLLRLFLFASAFACWLFYFEAKVISSWVMETVTNLDHKPTGKIYY